MSMMNRYKASFLGVAAATGIAVLAAGAATAADKAAIGGYCPVAYVKAGVAMKGDPKISAEQDGQTFLFSSDGAKQMFQKEPQKYKVAYKGWCATGVAMGKKIAANPEVFTVHDGVTYLFSNAEAKTMFDKNPAGTIAKADSAWPTLQ